MRFLSENTQTNRTAVGGGHVQGRAKTAQDGRMDRREEGNDEFCSQQAKGIQKCSVIMQLRVKRRVSQSCNRSVSRCVKRRDQDTTCPNVAAPHRSTVGDAKCAEPVCPVLLHSSHACVAQRMQPVLPCTPDSVIL